MANIILHVFIIVTNSSKCLVHVRWLGGDAEYPLAGLLIKQVHGATHFREAQKERSSFITSPSRNDIWKEGLSPFPSHDYPE